MGVGMPEYLLIFRKPPTDTTNAYADEPVVKHKPMTIDEETGETGPYDKNNKHQHIILNSGYSRARWQLDAHGFERSSGNRLLTAEELEGIAHHAIYKKYRHHSLRSGAKENTASEVYAPAPAILAPGRVDRYHAHADLKRRPIGQGQNHAPLPHAIRFSKPGDSPELDGGRSST
jgi:hypothetical protein